MPSTSHERKAAMSVAESTEERNGTHALTFAQALAQAETQARTALPRTLHERLSCAVALVKDGQVLEHEAGTGWTVADTQAPTGEFHVNGTCACADAATAPQHLC